MASTVLILTVVLLVGLLGRVMWIERHVTPEMTAMLTRQYTAMIPLTPNRGDLLFADGTPAAMSVRVYNLFADPAFIIDPEGKLNPLKDENLKEAQQRLVEALAPLVKKPATDLQFELEQNVYYKKEIAPGEWVNTDKPRRFMWLAKEVDDDFYNRFTELKATLQEQSQDDAKGAAKTKDAAARSAAAQKAAVLFHTLDGVGFVRSMKRVYPMGTLASSVIGIANRYEGVDGLEHQVDPMLKGIEGRMLVSKDAQRHTLLVQDQSFTPEDDGKSVWLTIDTVIQSIAEGQLQEAVQEHGAVSGTAIVMDPYSGRILALANYPSFDPENFGKVAADVRRDRAVTDPFEPGSIWKPFVMAGAIENGVVKPTDVIDCRQGYYVDPTGRTVRDDHAVGMATVADILIRSSNIGMTQIGWKMGIPLLHDTITRFGFGERTGVELPGDQKGIVKPLSEWNKGTLTSASFGYEVAATPIQLVRAFATFANGGYLVTPHVISAVETTPGKAEAWSDLDPQPGAPRIISEQTTATMREIMLGVLGPHGTARTAPSKIYQLYGKTGTAHVAAGSHGEAGHGYGENDYDSSFLVGGPYSKPRLVAIVTLHKPDIKIGYYGGTVSAPTAVAIMDRSLMYMHVPADLADAPAAVKGSPAGTGAAAAKSAAAPTATPAVSRHAGLR